MADAMPTDIRDMSPGTLLLAVAGFDGEIHAVYQGFYERDAACVKDVIHEMRLVEAEGRERVFRIPLVPGGAMHESVTRR